jgi:hypothetical protein
VTELGWTSVIVTDDDEVLGQEIADAIARKAWDLRDHYLRAEGGRRRGDRHRARR